MARWDPNARERIRHAAFELFAEQGFAATTVPQITERAGLTRRTFFRHFADKREVVFDGAELATFAAEQLAAVPHDGDDLAYLRAALHGTAQDRFEPRRENVRFVRDLIRADESINERNLHKRAVLAEILTADLVGRGTAPMRAALLAETAVTVLFVAVNAWLDHDGDAPLTSFVDEAFDELRSALAPAVSPTP